MRGLFKVGMIFGLATCHSTRFFYLFGLKYLDLALRQSDPWVIFLRLWQDFFYGCPR